MSLGTITRVNPVLALAITDVHPGAGRSPGVVDLPVERDIAGYPVIPRSGFKGVLKEFCFRTQDCLEKCASQKCLKEGRVSCSDAENKGISECLKCCCLFGPEPEEGEKGASVVVTTDLTPLALPAWAHRVGLVYVTTPWLLQRAYTIFQLVEESGINQIEFITYDGTSETLDIGEVQSALRTLIHAVKSLPENTVYATKYDKDRIIIIRRYVLSVQTALTTDIGKAIDMLSRTLRIVFKDSLAGDFGLVLVNDDVGRSLVDMLLVRRTRVRLQLDKKVVAEGALWTEEYIPAYTVFVGAIMKSEYYNEYCVKLCGSSGEEKKVANCLYDEMLEGKRLYLMLGGRMTLASGLLRVSIARVR